MTDAKTILVTGASSGIGKGIALRFGREGWRVALVARREAKLQEVAAAISDAGGEPHVIVADLSQEGAPDRVVATAIEALGDIDVLVNNAGMGNFESAEEISDAAYEAQFRLNVWACMAMVRAIVPHFREHGGGQLVNIGSVVGYIGYPKAAIYTSTKWALRGLNETWREELYPDGIKCAYVAPGYVITGFNDRDEQGTAEEREWALFPEDVAHAVWCIATQGSHSDIKEIIIQVQDRS